ncbi:MULTISPECIES: alternate-type signal peptide domain-containing protein [unclassified Arthrobacter]|uniref:alternate-type signal peptide domain-containing protein n=1 Tax=unclassified Arthrobacter TaxID=235627 RepID=UPI001D14C014|nr:MULTISPECIES: alternate-type signal peptide domain-containing protein [unclassified Arthrobacter]MCC3292061.1 alternate-type signal peptide domain-containing protein [Arthrobacter sp. zg-Y1110]MCC3302954.1 alternate-type signal peptide domain-containing protein [Arthrobacter sp. zg-Y895]UWX86538.1 alternate-type signal peptide domain-containing protein [Arthrobacter sp. zg-Y1110]
MAKGALAIGIGSAMLLGGGGTLAVWNDSEKANAGTIVSGDLDVTAAAGKWTNKAGTEIDITKYKVVPGDELTFTQDVSLQLDGDQMKATLVINEDVTNGFTGSAKPVPTLTQGGKTLNAANLTAANDVDTAGVVTAKAVFVFNKDTGARTDTNASLDLTRVNYVLTQVAK